MNSQKVTQKLAKSGQGSKEVAVQLVKKKRSGEMGSWAKEISNTLSRRGTEFVSHTRLC